MCNLGNKWKKNIHWKSIFFARGNSKTKDIIGTLTDSDS